MTWYTDELPEKYKDFKFKGYYADSVILGKEDDRILYTPRTGRILEYRIDNLEELGNKLKEVEP